MSEQTKLLRIYTDEASYFGDRKVFEVPAYIKAMVEKMFNGAATAKGALIITPAKVIVTTPGADNKKEI